MTDGTLVDELKAVIERNTEVIESIVKLFAAAATDIEIDLTINDNRSFYDILIDAMRNDEFIKGFMLDNSMKYMTLSMNAYALYITISVLSQYTGVSKDRFHEVFNEEAKIKGTLDKIVW